MQDDLSPQKCGNARWATDNYRSLPYEVRTVNLSEDRSCTFPELLRCLAERMAGKESEKRGAPCLAFIPREPTPAGAAGAPSFSTLRWPEGTKELKVHFSAGKSGKIPTWRLSEKTSSIQSFITPELVLQWANVWHDEGGVTVPKFVRADSMEDSDIRVKLVGESSPGIMCYFEGPVALE